MTQKGITFVKYFERWYETYRKPKLRPVSAQKYHILMRQLKISKLGQMELKKIKRKDVQEFFNDFGKTRRRVTVLDNHKFIKASFADAVLDGLIKTNPCSRIEIVSVEDNWDVMKRKEVREKKKWLELDEYKKTKLYLIGMLNCSFQQDEKAELLFKNNKNEIVSVLKPRTYVPQMALMTIYVALKTGARVSEILGLTKEDVDFDSATLNIDKTWDYKFGGGFTETKNTSSIRKIGVDKEFLRVMEIYFWWLDKHNIKTDQGAIFVKEKVKVHNSLPNSILKRIFECLEIEPISLHKLRHTHASILIAQGISLQVIAKRLGHSDTSMIQKTYGHLLESVEERENKRILEVI